jgi:hypothetical protein
LYYIRVHAYRAYRTSFPRGVQPGFNSKFASLVASSKVFHYLTLQHGKGTLSLICCRLHLKCDGTRAETRFRLSVKRTSPFKSAGASVQSTAGSRGVRISRSNGSSAGYTMFQGSVKGTGYLLHSPVSPSLSLPYVTVCYYVSIGLCKKRLACIRPDKTCLTSVLHFLHVLQLYVPVRAKG